MKFSNYYQRSAIKSAPILPLSRENFIFNFIQLPHQSGGGSRQIQLHTTINSIAACAYQNWACSQKY